MTRTGTSCLICNFQEPFGSVVPNIVSFKNHTFFLTVFINYYGKRELQFNLSRHAHSEYVEMNKIRLIRTQFNLSRHAHFEYVEMSKI